MRPDERVDYIQLETIHKVLLACIWVEAFSGSEGDFLEGRDGLPWWHIIS